MTEVAITPNAPSAVRDQPAVPTLDSISAKMTAMREQAQRNLEAQMPKPAAGSPQDPEATEPEIEDSETTALDADQDPDSALEDQVTDTGTTADSTSEELIDFLEFAEAHPDARFRFMRNGREVVIDARKAAAILGQGSAIHDEARQLKIERSEFDEYRRETQARQEGLILAMEFTIEPQLRQAYDEIVKTQQYQSVFQQQLASTQDHAQRARIQASMQQNERYIQQQQATIARVRPQVDQFRQARQEQVREVLDTNRRNFTDRELKNEFVFNEIREKVSKNWSEANAELIPGIRNIDLISSDEHILGLIRDGLRYRDRPRARSAGASIAQVQNRRASVPKAAPDQDISRLREQARSGDKKAADNLLVAQLNRLRAARGQRA